MKKNDAPDLAKVELRQVLQALSDPVRLSIVAMAAEHDELPCNAFAENIPKSTASHHWKVLCEAGLIHQRMEGTRKLNSLRKTELERRFPGLLKSILSAAKKES